MDKSDYSDVNFPLDKEGRTLHVGVRKGEVANVRFELGRAIVRRPLTRARGPAHRHHGRPAARRAPVRSARPQAHAHDAARLHGLHGAAPGRAAAANGGG